MTRNFDKQPRDDERPYSRNSSSGRYGEERPPRPARPRLNRNAVDRAWENGARQNHADYRARSPQNTQHGQPPRDNWRSQQQADQSSAQHGRDNRRPYGNRQDDHRQSERTPNRYQGSRPRPYESGMRKFDEHSYDERRNNPARPASGPSRPGYRDTPRYPNNRPPTRPYNRDNERAPRRPFDRDERPARPYNRDDQPRRFERDERPAHPYNRDDQPRRFERDERQPRPYNRDDRDHQQPRRFERFERDSRGFDRDRRRGHDEGRPDPRNPRWQSRPERFTPKPREISRQAPGSEQFEGDYEHFDAHIAPPEVEEPQVTRLPDGRVLKGPREVQQRDAEFWTGVNEESASLLQHIEPAVKKEGVEPDASETEPVEPSPGEKKPKTRKRTASAVARGRKTGGKQKATDAGRAKSRPSQRGYKWPKSE